MNLAKTIFLAGAAKRNPGLFEKYRFLKNTESWSLEKLREHQLKALKNLLKLADRHSVFYHNYFKKQGFDPSISSLDDLRQLPPITKDQLIIHNSQIHTDLKFNKTFLCETSGSSGQVLSFIRNEPWDSANRAAQMRGYSWYNANPWDKNIYLWGFDVGARKQVKTRVLDYLQNRQRLFSYSEKSISKLCKELERTTYLHGYSSMIYEFARIINEKGISLQTPNLKMIKGTSEKIHTHYQEVIQKAFGKMMISEYGASEASLIAFECPYGKMHITMENVFVEEEDGEIVVTNLEALSFPIIRYKLGDYVKLAETNTCSCGMAHSVIEEIHGRVGKNIYGIVGKYPSLTLYYVFKNLFFEKGLKFNYQCVQEEKGDLKVLIREPLIKNAEQLIRAEFEKYFKTDVAITILFSQDFRDYHEKLIDFISKID